MISSTFRPLPVCCVALLCLLATGCAHDRSMERGGSLKDTPVVAAPAPKATAKTYVAPKARPRTPAPRADSPAPPSTPRAEPPAREVVREVPLAPRRVTITPSVPTLPTAPPFIERVNPPPRAEPQPPPSQPAPNGNLGQRLLQEGRALFQQGKVLAAREKFVGALTAPLPDVLLALARSYDPNYLDTLPNPDADADVDRARALYEQAVALGSTAAEEDLGRLIGR